MFARGRAARADRGLTRNNKEHVAAEKKKAKEEGLVDYVSTNDIITSFFLGEMDAGQMVRAGTPAAPRAPRRH